MTRPVWRSLTGRLTLAFVGLSLVSLGLVGVLSYLSVREGYRELTTAQVQVFLTRQLQAYVLAHGSLKGYSGIGVGAPGDGPPDTGLPVPEGAGQGPPRLDDQRPPPTQDDGGPFRVLDAQYRLLGSGEVWPVARRAQPVPVSVSGRVVAYLISTGNYPPLDARSTEFLRRTRQAILTAMALTGLLALGLGLLTARTLLQPLRQLLGGIHAMQRGRPVQVQASRRQDELDELLLAFAAMTESVRTSQRARRQLTADLAHDVNTPLSIISGSLEAMLDGTFPPDPQRLSRLHQEAQHIGALVRDLRFLALADAGELPLTRRPTELWGLVNGTVSNLQETAAQAGVTVEVRVPTTPAWSDLDSTRTVQVLHNLLGNALTHTEAGGRVTVTGRRVQGGLEVTVQDTGQGIAGHDLPHVFDRLYRADSARSDQGSGLGSSGLGSSGLGLTISRSIIEAHGGSIRLSSVHHQGTAVTFVLPVTVVPVNEEVQAQTVLGERRSGR